MMASVVVVLLLLFLLLAVAECEVAWVETEAALPALR